MGRLRASCWELPLASPLFVHDLTRLQSLAQLSAQPLPMQPTLTLLCTSIHHIMPQQGTTIFRATSRQGHRPTSQSSPPAQPSSATPVLKCDLPQHLAHLLVQPPAQALPLHSAIMHPAVPAA